MKSLLILVLLATPAFSQKGVPASRRYKEPTPIQMVFGSFTKPTTYYNNASAYSAVPDGQIEPSSITLDTNSFASATGLNSFKTSFSTNIGSLGVASNTATLTTSGNQGIIVTDTATVYALTVPQFFVSCTISQNGTAGGGTADSVGCGAGKDGSNWVIAHANKPIGHVCITIDVAGSTTDLACTSNGTFTAPTPPWQLGFSLVGNQATAWQSTNGTTWTKITASSVSSQKDFTASGALTSWVLAFESDLASSSSSWKFTNIKGGAYGGVGLRDMHIVTYPDGRPYMIGPVVYLAGGVADASGTTSSTSTVVFTYNVLTSALTAKGVIGTTRSSHTYNDEAASIIYDPANGTERMVIVNWATAAAGSVTSFYVSQTIATDDWLAGGYHVTPTLAAMTLPYDNTNNWDPDLKCAGWNYSASTCSLWQLAYSGPAGSSHPHIATSTSDPSINSWSGVANINSISGFEGTTIVRTATGSAGVSYSTCVAGASSVTKCYNQAGTLTGSINATPPSDTNNPPWPGIICYLNTCYYITFDANLFGAIGESMGNFTVSTAPRY